MSSAPRRCGTEKSCAARFGTSIATSDGRRFVAELHRRGFRAIENAGQMVIFCNNEPVRIVRHTVFAGENAVFRKSRLFRVGIADNSVIAYRRVTRKPDPVTRPHRQEGHRHRLVPRPPFEPERRSSSASRSGPSIIANPAPGQTRAPAGKRDDRPPLTAPCRSPSPSAPDRTRRVVPKPRVPVQVPGRDHDLRAPGSVRSRNARACVASRTIIGTGG
jgi:hypothetical protein